MLNIFKPKLPPNFELIELENVCRICLHSTNNLLSLFNNQIDYLISEFLPQKIYRKPLQPHQICNKCYEDAKIAYIFKKQCEYSDELIKSITNDELNNPDEEKSYEKETQTDSTSLVESYEKCEKKFESIQLLKQHNLKEFDKSSNTCKQCGKNFINIATLRDHLNSDHEGFVNNTCNLCKKSFSRKSHLKRHLLNIHSVSEKIKEMKVSDHEGNNNCHICKKSFSRKDHLKRHLLNIHSVSEKIKREYQEELPKFVDIGKYEYFCEFCSKTFKSDENFENHICNENSLEMNVLENNCENDLDEFIVDDDDNSKTNFKTNSENNYSDYVEDLPDDTKSENTCSIEVDEQNNTSVMDIKLENKITLEGFKTTQEIVKTMIKESKKKIPKIKVKPNAHGNYECETCQKVFTRAAHLTRHQLLHSGDPKPYACTMCSKTFSRSDHLKNHVNGFHADLRPYQCSTCEKSFTRNEHLKRHTLICSTERKRRRKEKLFSCNICMRKFSSEKYVQDHIAVQHNESKEFSCKYCSVKVLGATEYKKHCKSHYNTTSKQFLCSECGGSFTKLQYLMIHIRRHTGEKPFKCRYCDKAFPRTTDQYAHERSHTGEKNFHCLNCPKSFSTAYKLRVHMRIHTGERPYKCLYCPKAFAQNNDLKAHHRRHTGERFYCNLCDLGFVQMYVLRQHKRQVHGIDEPRGRTSLLDKAQIIPDDNSLQLNNMNEKKLSQNNDIKQNTEIKNEVIVCGLDSQDKFLKLIASV